MTDQTAAAPTTPPPSEPQAQPPARTKTKLGDILFGWKSAVVIFIGGLILGGLGGAGIGAWGHHHPRGERMFFQMRNGGPGFPGGGMYGGYGGFGYGGGGPIPPGVQPNPPKAPSASASPKTNG